MADFWARTALMLYRGVGSILYPFSGPFLRARARKGKEDRSRRAERYGYASWKRPEGPLVWLHAASVGESLAIMPLIKRMESFGINLVFTTGTVTSASIAEDRLSERTIHQYVPMDVKRAVRRFLDHWQPDLVIFAESEIWPMTISELAKRNVPQILVNARMSDRSNRRWQKRPALAQAIFGQLSQVIAQSETDGERFRSLGAPWVSVAGNLKTDVGVPQVDERVLAKIKSQIQDRPTWVSVSTHRGEEAIMGRVHRMVASHAPGLLTIIVPRHPDRSREVEEELQAQGLNVVTRSSGKSIGSHTDVFLGDTIGEMGLYLRLSEIAFMGKSLAAEGGQNPIEPAMTGAAILSGRYVQNFRETYQKLLDAGGARLVSDENMLASHVLHLLRKRSDLEMMRDAARETVDGMTGALERTTLSLDAYIMPLRVQVGLQQHKNRAASASNASGAAK
ncbi:lipid IV(A) 3-deoxy-D-manno-octulosonic acid transferase [Pseudahrensia aquimaris]|uniref:3-deoxy-D-manno-octulosonic acid transferase n=1 Tax=Pseudahrensia aquimaris TaxID=744461 RepID=A0ABW3FDX9_9HYPH